MDLLVSDDAPEIFAAVGIDSQERKVVCSEKGVSRSIRLDAMTPNLWLNCCPATMYLSTCTPSYDPLHRMISPG
jgi:hypothetical protein